MSWWGCNVSVTAKDVTSQSLPWLTTVTYAAGEFDNFMRTSPQTLAILRQCYGNVIMLEDLQAFCANG